MTQATSNTRKNTSDTLRRMSVDFAKGSPGQEDLEDAGYFNRLATKNDNGTLTIKEAREIADVLEEENPVIIDTDEGRWVETG